MSRKDKKDWGIDTLLSVHGFGFELWRVIVQALRKRDGNVDNLRRLLNEPDLVDKVFDLIVREPSIVCLQKSATKFLAENEHLVYVDYDMPRDKSRLEVEFSNGGVSELFYRSVYGYYRWENHPSCAEIDPAPGYRIMLVKYYSGNIMSEDAIAEMNKLGFRPATHLELYAFAKANPELQLLHSIVALGSSAMYDDDRCFALLSSAFGRRILHHIPSGLNAGLAHFGSRFLFVRKAAGLVKEK